MSVASSPCMEHSVKFKFHHLRFGDLLVQGRIESEYAVVEIFDGSNTPGKRFQYRIRWPALFLDADSVQAKIMFACRVAITKCEIDGGAPPPGEYDVSAMNLSPWGGELGNVDEAWDYWSTKYRGHRITPLIRFDDGMYHARFQINQLDTDLDCGAHEAGVHPTESVAEDAARDAGRIYVDRFLVGRSTHESVDGEGK